MINTITMTHSMTITHTSRWEKKMYTDLESFLDFMEFKVDDKSYSARRGTIRNKFSKFVKEKKIEFCYNDGIAF